MSPLVLKRIAGYIGLCIVLLVGLSAVLLHAEYRNENVRVSFLDIGQGDSILIETKYHQRILIDGGPSRAVMDKIGSQTNFTAMGFDMIIATHPDADHITGLIEVLEHYTVDVFLEPGIVHTSNVYHELEGLLEREHIPVRNVTQPMRFELGEGLVLDVLYPVSDFSGTVIADNNNASVVVKLTDGTVDYLFTGDAPLEVEQKLIELYGDALDSDVLKIGHHGSDTSSSDEFLDVVTPDIAVIQVGAKNRYGHPHQRVLNRLNRRDIAIFRNDQQGTITLSSDGEHVWLVE